MRQLNPHVYRADFLTRQEADDLFACCQAPSQVRELNKMNGSMYSRRLSIAGGGWNDYGTRRGRKIDSPKPIERVPFLNDAPWVIKKLAIKLSLLAGTPVNYFGLVGYENERDRMLWHQHGEDRDRDARVFDISLGATRTFGLRELCPQCRVCVECNEAACDGHDRSCPECVTAKKHKVKCPLTNDQEQWILLQPTHGSLIILPDDLNWTHEHCVLEDESPKSLRISINTKSLPIDDSLEDFIKRMERPTSHKPAVYDCHAGCKYPPDAVYVGREVRDRRTGTVSWLATPFGNYKKLTGDAFRAHAADKMKDAEFRKQVESLRGKDLLCWCRPHEIENCHARIWLELANA
jgi:alkylated DNA repair dioxygenase AlkB